MMFHFLLQEQGYYKIVPNCFFIYLLFIDHESIKPLNKISISYTEHWKKIIYNIYIYFRSTTEPSRTKNTKKNASIFRFVNVHEM